jgi:DNA-binding NtrC family response regulator
MKTRWEILTVDDEEVMCESLAAWLREDGYAVDTASSGREAIEKAAAKDYAIYFIDLKMPGGMDGIETMMEIRRMHADASIIIITAYATVDTAITAMKEGAQEYIVKPCNPEEISAQETEPPIPLRRHHQQERAHAGDSGPGARGSQPAQHGADPRRERHGKGTDRARHSQFGRTRGQTLRSSIVRGTGGDAARIRIVRA